MDYSKLLREFRFSEYEIKIYLALAKLGTGRASIIAKESGVPHNKVYSCLSRLVEKGYVAELEVHPKEFKVLGLGQFRENLQKKEAEIKEIKLGLNRLEEDIEQKKVFSDCLATVFRGHDKIVQMQNEFHPKLKKFQYSLVGGTSFNHTSGRLITEGVRRGIEYRFLTYYDKRYEDIYQKWKNAGVKMRFHNKEEWKSIRFSTLDEKWCRITFGKPQIPDRKDYLTFWIESSALALLLKDIFLKLWNESNSDGDLPKRALQTF